MRKYSRVTYRERCQISILLQDKKTLSEIARILNRHKSTISRELKRNRITRDCGTTYKYDEFTANKNAIIRFQKYCRRKLKIEPNYRDIVLNFLKRKWSPEQIAGRISLEKKIPVSHMTIYRFIKKHDNLRCFLMHKGRRYPPTRYVKSPKTNLKKTIHERPFECERRLEIGHWERDLMYAKNREGILVCTDRKSRFTAIEKLETTKNAIDTKKLTEKLIQNINGKILTITNDNGTEFSEYTNNEYQVYFSDPGKPHQRGTVENTIGVIRRFIKNQTDLKDINLPEISKWLNTRPRKVLNFKTPEEIFYSKSVAMVL